MVVGNADTLELQKGSPGFAQPDREHHATPVSPFGRGSDRQWADTALEEKSSPKCEKFLPPTRSPRHYG